MRPEGNQLDLNNLPDDYGRDGKHVFEEGSSSGYRKKKSGAKDGKDECGKVYECRFCSLKFCKSQALGGHMNRHRQERETETLNRARQLVFSNDNIAAQGAPHLGCCHPTNPISPPQGGGGVGYHHPPPPPPEATLPLRFSARINIPPPLPQQQPCFYTSPSRPAAMSISSHYPPHHQHSAMSDYYVGHVLGGGGHPNLNYAAESSYTCIGAPVGHGFGGGSSRGNTDGGGRDDSVEEGLLNWGRSYSGTTQQRLDAPASINRFQDGF